MILTRELLAFIQKLYWVIFSGTVWRSALTEISRIENNPVIEKCKKNSKLMEAWKECKPFLQKQLAPSIAKRVTRSAVRKSTKNIKNEPEDDAIEQPPSNQNELKRVTRRGVLAAKKTIKIEPADNASEQPPNNSVATQRDARKRSKVTSSTRNTHRRAVATKKNIKNDPFDDAIEQPANNVNEMKRVTCRGALAAKKAIKMEPADDAPEDSHSNSVVMQRVVSCIASKSSNESSAAVTTVSSTRRGAIKKEKNINTGLISDIRGHEPSNNEIGVAFGKKPTTVKVRINRAAMASIIASPNRRIKVQMVNGAATIRVKRLKK